VTDPENTRKGIALGNFLKARNRAHDARARSSVASPSRSPQSRVEVEQQPLAHRTSTLMRRVARPVSAVGVALGRTARGPQSDWTNTRQTHGERGAIAGSVTRHLHGPPVKLDKTMDYSESDAQAASGAP